MPTEAGTGGPVATPLPALPVWDLDSALDSLGGAEALRHWLVNAIAELGVLYDRIDVRAGAALSLSSDLPEAFETVLTATDTVLEAERLLTLYHAGRCWADGTDQAASAAYLELHAELVPLASLRSRLESWAARLPMDDLAAKNGTAEAHRHWIERCAAAAPRRLPAGEQDLLEQLRTNGQLAWQRLYEDLIGHAIAPYDGQQVPLAALRAQASSPSSERRQAAHIAAENACAAIALPAAACLNALKGEALVLSRRCGWDNALDKCLDDHGVDKRVLELVHATVQRLLPLLRGFARTKARLLGHDGLLPWWDVAAPLPGDEQLTWAQATDLIVGAFRQFSPRVANHALRALNNGWVDAQGRPGKRTTALCMPMRRGEARLLVNFDGSCDSVLSCAHELGHAYHYLLLGSCTELQRKSPLSLQETASLWCESLVLNAAERDSALRLSMLNANLIGLFQTVVDVHSRFLFEQELLRRRAVGPLTTDEMCELSMQAQLRSYADSVAPETLPRYAWVARPHFYTSTFGNWPYYFGLLLGLALFAGHGNTTGAARLDQFLSRTGTHSPAELVAGFDADITNHEFWMAGVAVIEQRVNEFDALAAP